MQSYVVLMNLTEQGVKDIKDAPDRIKAGIEGLAAMGGKVTAFYAVMGEYDYIAIGEAPNDAVMATFMMALGRLGNVRTTTLRAFTTEEFAQMVGSLP